MSDQSTVKMISAYFKDAVPTAFLSGFFRSPPENFFNSKEVEIDIERSGEDVAIALTDLATGYRVNEFSKYTNKKFAPPVFKEAAPLNGLDLLNREPGRNPFEDVQYMAAATRRAFKNFREVEKKIRRSIELMCSQVLQTGTLTLVDADSNTVFSMDFSPKSSHFADAGTEWDQNGNDKIADLEALARQIRVDGKRNPDTLIFGRDAWRLFIADETVLAQLDNRRVNLGEVAPQVRGQGATFMGRVMIGTYWFNLWTYDGGYDDPETGEFTDYVDPIKVIMLTSGARLDLVFGNSPRLAPPESRVLPFLPSRMSNGPAGMDMTTNAWLTPDGETLMTGVSARPLPIPTDIDSFGCLDTGITPA